MKDIPVKALRGAITVDRDEPADILGSTEEVLRALLGANGLEAEDLISVIFSATEDLNSEFPARAAREMGLDQVPLLCCRELSITGSLPRCIRVLAHAWMPEKSAQHVYLRDAVKLRSDLSAAQ